MEGKRGQLSNLQGIIAVLIVVGVLIGAGLLILETFLGELDNTAASVTNETGGFINITGYTLGDAGVTGFNSLSITEASNSTSGQVILAANFTVTDVGVVTNATTQTWEAVNFTYNYLRGENGFIGLNTTLIAFLTIPDLLGLIVLIAMVGIILAIIFNVIPGARVSGA